MKNSLSVWQLAGFIFTGFAGVILHFLYDWTNSSILALFSAVNESIFEHMKLLFFPMLLFAVVESLFIGEKYDDFWCAKLIGILAGMVLIPIIYYAYTGIFGVSADWFNIAIFYIAAAVSYIIETRIIESGSCFIISPTVAKMILAAVAVVFILFTFFPPSIPLFKDPQTNQYGINVNRH